jgi:hypothetical protein
MKLERLEMLKLISTKNVIVNEVMRGLDKKFYYNKYELEINLSLVLFTLLGNTELHKEMEREDIDWVGFVNDNYSLIEELKTGEYAEVYNDIFNEVKEGANKKAKYAFSTASVLEEIGNALTPENIEKIKSTINQVKE